MTTSHNESKSFFEDLAARLTGQLIVPEDAAYEQVRSLWNGGVTTIQQHWFAVRIRKMFFRPCVGLVRMGWRSPFAVEGMILRDEPCMKAAS